MFFRNPAKDKMPKPDQALPGREQAMTISSEHFILGSALKPPYPDGSESIVLGMGCFWGAEKRFWSLPGIVTTAVGYSAGFTPNPSYEEVCSGLTGHNEVVLVVFNPAEISLDAILKVFWESHNPTQGMQQGNDRGTQYRSGIYYSNAEQQRQAEASKAQYQTALKQQLGQGVDPITTEIISVGDFYFAEEYHQQYLAKNPNGYCGLGGMGVCYS